MDVSSALNISLHELTDARLLEADWCALELRADCSFFQSWAWIGCWVRGLLAEGRKLRVVTIRDGDQLVGLAVLVARRQVRHGLLRSNCLYLHESGERRFDQLTIEHNGILADRRLAERVVGICIEWLTKSTSEDWDELYLSGVTPLQRRWIEHSAGIHGLRIVVGDQKRCDYVNLDAIRDAGHGYLDTLSSNTRYQIRRAFRLYEASGPLSLTSARDMQEAMAFFDEMKILHQLYWQQRGHPGAFANDFFEHFHRTFIREQYHCGQVQLLSVQAGASPVGYLYNFVRNGHVYAYQSGFQYSDDPKVKPGLVAHCLAIELNLKGGKAIYDFLAGDTQYKRSLGTERTDLSWLVLQKNHFKFRLEDHARQIKHGVNAVRARWGR